MEKRMSTTLACILYATLLWGEKATINGVTWSYTTKVDGEETIAVITGASPKSGKLTVPAKLPRSGEYPVREIAEDAFASDNDSITEVVFPESMRRIGDRAFFGCSGLTSVTIPDGVTSIGNASFYGCNSLKSITIPNSVTNIDFGAFYGCTNLTTVVVSEWQEGWRRAGYNLPNGIKVVIPVGTIAIRDSAFNSCGWLASVTIPDSVTNIGSYAFSGCSGLTSVTIPDSVTSIGDNAFSYCGLTSVAIPDSVSSIGDYVFNGCSALVRVEILDGVSNIGAYVFSGCSGLTSVTIPDSVTSIGEGAFSGCSGLTSVTIPSGATSIGSSAFSGCSGLTSVEIPTSVTTIGNSAFSGCSGLTSVTIPSGVTSIGDNAFYGCSGLKDVTVPQYVLDAQLKNVFGSCYSSITNVSYSSTITNISAGAFWGCSGLTSVTIPDSVTSIGERAFWHCSGLTSVEIPTSVTTIWNAAFEGCSGLTSVTIPDSVTSIGYSPFYDCSGVKNVTVPQSALDAQLNNVFGGCYSSITNVSYSSNVTNISAEAFWYCSGLTSVEIPTSVTTIGNSAFEGCSGLTSVTIPDSVTSIGFYAFRGCSGLTSVEMPNSVTSIGSSAFSGCSGLTSVTIPDSVTSIGQWAFWGCSGLENVTFLGEVPEGVSSSYILSNASSVRYPKKYASMYEQFVPSSQFGGYVGVEDFLNFHGKFVNDETKPWDDDCSVSHDRQASMRSGNIGNNESTWIELTVNGTGRLSFWWKASSEEYNGDVFDYAYLSVDGVPQGTLDGNYRLNGIAIGGKTDWTNVVVHIAGDGSHTVRWTYCKDYVDESDVGEDCVWLDEVSFAPLVSLSYSLGGGEGNVPVPTQYYAGDSIVLPTGDSLINPKHRFVGWSDGTKTYDAGAEYVVTDSSVEFTAVWTANTLVAPAITSADVANGGTIETAGTTINIAADNGTVIYYTLDGTDPTTDGTRYTAPFSANGMSVRIRAIAVKDNYFDSPVADFSFTRKPYSAAECLNAEGTFATGGSDVAWRRVLGETAHDGVAAMRSGVIGDSGTSSIEMTVEGAGEIGFWWKSSSEISRNRKYDYVSFLIDGEEQSWLGGEKDWTNEVFTVSGSGTHTLKWVYQKNGNGQTQGEDCAWLDEVTWTPAESPDPIPLAVTDDDVAAALVGIADASLAVNVTNAVQYAAYRDWALSITNATTTAQTIKESTRTWLSYAFAADALIDKELTSDDVKIESFTPASTDGKFEFTVSVKDVSIGGGSVAVETLKENLKKVLGIEGATTLTTGAFSSDNIDITFDAPVDGKARFTVSPPVDVGSSFFMRVKVK